MPQNCNRGLEYSLCRFLAQLHVMNNMKAAVDLFVKMPPKFFNYIEASEYLRKLLGCDVDLISDHRNLRPFFRKQIERDGINIFTTEGNSQRFVGAN